MREATDDELRRVHSAEYLRRVAELEAAGGGMLDPDTWVSAGSTLAARLAAGACIEAVSFVLGGKRPKRLVPGPPARTSCPASRGHGILHLRQCRPRRGRSPRPLRGQPNPDRRLRRPPRQRHAGNLLRFRRVSGSSRFIVIRSIPGTGAQDETGTGAGLGYTLNIPLPYGTPRADYHAAFRSGLERLADRIRPELVLISAGFDAHAEDPVGDLGLEVEDFEILTSEIVAVAETHAQGRIVSVLEGGYNVPILAGSVAAHLHSLGAEPGAT